jgi:hypothetical protein
LAAGCDLGKPVPADATRATSREEVRNTINEIMAYQPELGNAERFGLTADEVARVKELRASYYSLLPREYQQRVARGAVTLK